MDVEEKAMDSTFMEDLEKNVLDSFRSVMKKITAIWKELGISEELQYGRAKTAQNYVLSCMEEMAESEICLYNDIVKRIDKYTMELSELTTLLDAEPIIVDESIGLLDKEKYLRHHLDELVKERHDRMKVLQELRNEEQKLCTILSLPIYEISSTTGIPNKTDFRELEDHIRMLKEERERRHNKFRLAKRELTTIMETTELAPESNFEREVICYEDDQFLLSTENLKELDEFVAKVKSMKSNLEKQKEILLEKLIKLWDRLNITNDERGKFLSKHADCRMSTMKSIQKEIERCEEIKKKNIKSYIQILHEELQDLWKRCHISEFEQNQFSTAFDNEFSEEVLNAYEVEVQNMTKYYRETADILQKIEKRQGLWDLMLAFKNKASDPNRFVNRGGNLLQEERERKKLQKDLPKLECDLFKAIQDYEENSGKLFQFNGMNFQDFVSNQWAQRLDDKENEKMMRQKQRNLMVEHEVTMGTPSNKRTLSCVPKSAPSKMMKSNAGTSIYRTPGMGSRMKTPDTLSSTRIKSYRRVNATPQKASRFIGLKATPNRASPRFSAAKVKGTVLMEKNKNTESSESLDNTSYSDFANELDRPSRSGLRSTVLAPKKVLGGKGSSIMRKRKSAGTASKSLRSLNRAQPKLTPVRGKLGLPFLI